MPELREPEEQEKDQESIAEMTAAADAVANAMKTFNQVAQEQRDLVLKQAIDTVEAVIRLSTDARQIMKKGETSQGKESGASAEEAGAAVGAAMEKAVAAAAKTDASASSPVQDTFAEAAAAFGVMMNQALINQGNTNTIAQAALASGVQILFEIPKVVIADLAQDATPEPS